MTDIEHTTSGSNEETNQVVLPFLPANLSSFYYLQVVWVVISVS